MSDDEKAQFDLKAFATELRDDIKSNQIKLPTLPTLSLEALLVVNDAGSSMADVARIVSKDTSMAARLVRYANSPLYQGISKVASVKTAITRIGIDAVKHAILSLAMKDVFTTNYPMIRNRMEALWQHSVQVATKATMLAEFFPHIKQDEAMLAGLIHDVGVIPILLKAKDYEYLLEHETHLDKLIQSLHMSVGKFMLSFWEFDPVLIEVVATHDKLDREPASDQVDYVDIIQVANILSYEGTDHRYSSLEQREIPSFQRVGLEYIEKIKSQINNEKEIGISVVLH
ncbi:MAG: HDOD domain-containing protein [Gammaproteobacteria bacterium]|nr:HDOD domain-containing protein [Gammaproteobacteria bacterium]